MTQLVVLLCAACASDKKQATRQESKSALVNLLSDAKTPIEASEALRSAEFKSCQDLLAVLRSIDARDASQRFDAPSEIGLVAESLDASRLSCPKKDQKKSLSVGGKSSARAIALSLIVADPQVALVALAKAQPSAHVLRRQAQLYFVLEHHVEGRDALAASLRYEDDEAVRVKVARMLTLDGDPQAALQLCEGHDGEPFALPRVGALAALGQYKEVIHQIDAAELHLKQELAEEAARFALDPIELASENLASAELLVALRLRIGNQLDDRGAGLLERAALLNPDDGDLWITLAELLESTGRQQEAVAAWDQAAKYTPGSERPLLAPIRILLELGQAKAALTRAKQLAKLAKGSGDAAAETMRMASLGYRYAGDTKRALEFARRASANRPGDGRLIAELASRSEEAGMPDESAALLSNLLVCGARGQAWHRHEIAARLTALVGADDLGTHISKSMESCAVVDLEDLRHYISGSD